MKRAFEMTDEELAAEVPGLAAVALKHSPVCTCTKCHRYIEVGMEQFERSRQTKSDDCEAEGAYSI